MPITFFTGRQDNVGADTSNITGNPWWVGDFRQLTVSIATSTASASRVTIVGSNLDGFKSTLSSALATASNALWSHITVITAGQGLYTVDCGFRWVNAIRPDFTASAASNMTVTFAGRA